MGIQQNGRPLDPTDRRSPVGERVHINEVAGFPGAGATSLPELSDVDDLVTPSKGSVLVGDGSEYQEEAAGADGEILVYDSIQLTGVRAKPESVTPVLFGADNVSPSTTTRYLFPGNADRLAETVTPNGIRITHAGALRHLHVQHNAPGGNGNFVTYTVVVNGTPTALLVNLASTASTASNVVSVVPVVVGDLVEIRVTKAASVGASPRNVIATLEVA